MPTDSYTDDVVSVPRAAIRWPLEIPRPSGFRPEDPATWPDLQGRLEYVEGRLLFMPPCGDLQQDVAWSLPTVFEPWLTQNREFVGAANEAGMLLQGEIRAADGAIWRRVDVEPRTGGFRRVPPILAVEIAGRDEDEANLREKARWYLDRGVAVVWLIFPETRELVILRPASESRHGAGQKLPSTPELPGLEVEVDRIFRQLS